MREEILLTGRHVVVTGGATGIGFAIASELVDAGALVTLVGRRLEQLQRAAQELGERCAFEQFDLAETQRLGELFERLEQRAPVDALVNNAGVNFKKDYLDFTSADLDRILTIQAKVPFLLSQQAAGHMKPRKSGCILLVSSLSTRLGMPRNQPYTLSKSGMVGLTRSLATELGPFGIRVNSLNPGFVDTELFRNTNSPERAAEIVSKTPLRRLTDPKDIGMAAAFLISDAARFITGVDLVVDGGISSSFLI